jgi:site-specific DNA-methyltransferase (adenine-specific)
MGGYERIIKDDGVIALFGSEPFSSALRMSNIKLFKYDWIWRKARPNGFLNAKKMPMKAHEIISIFYKKSNKYYPQNLILKDKQNKNTGKENVYGKVKKDFFQEITYTNYPCSVLEYKNPTNGVHPTQKPLELCEYLIETYTKENEIVLDNASGSSTTGVACKKINRKWICIENEEEYCKISKNRLLETP